SRSPAFPGPRHSRLLRDFGKHSRLVVVQTIFAEVGDIQIFPAIIVVVADTDSLSPATCCQTRLDSYIRKSAVVIIAIEVVGGTLPCGEPFHGSAVYKENIGPAIVVVVKYRY